MGESSERLIEYYFQRKLSGTALEDIRISLGRQLIEEEDCERILKLISLRETRYHRQRQRQRRGRLLIVAAIASLILCAVSYLMQNLAIAPIPLWFPPLPGIVGLIAGGLGFFMSRQ